MKQAPIEQVRDFLRRLGDSQPNEATSLITNYIEDIEDLATTAATAHDEMKAALEASLLAIPDGMLSNNQDPIVRQIREALTKAKGATA